jgi:succinate-acetate transporter protein
LVILAIGNFNLGSAATSGLIQFGGYAGLVTALSAWYTSAAGMSAGMGGKLRFPVGPALIK